MRQAGKHCFLLGQNRNVSGHKEDAYVMQQTDKSITIVFKNNKITTKLNRRQIGNKRTSSLLIGEAIVENFELKAAKNTSALTWIGHEKVIDKVIYSYVMDVRNNY